jgi:hypothetical protein
MARLPNACRLARRFLVIAVFASQYLMSQDVPLPGSSSPATKSPTLEVLSANYQPETDTIQFKLVNRSQKAATGYEVAFGVSDGTQINWHGGLGENLLNLVLAEQCQNAGGTSAAGHASADNSWEGAIKPGGTYVHSFPANNMDKSEPSGSAATIRMVVAGVVWSDGSVEVDQNFPWAAMSIKRSREVEKQDASDSARVVAILNAHSDDPDIQHRVGAIIESLQALLDDAHVQPTANAASEQRHFVVGNVLSNLKNFASLADPKEAFEAYSAFVQCQNERRSALLTLASSVSPAQ